MIFDPAFIPIFKQSIKADLESLNKTGPVCHSGHKKIFFLKPKFYSPVKLCYTIVANSTVSRIENLWILVHLNVTLQINLS